MNLLEMIQAIEYREPKDHDDAMLRAHMLQSAVDHVKAGLTMGDAQYTYRTEILADVDGERRIERVASVHSRESRFMCAFHCLATAIMGVEDDA